jgi:hypothetical protein
VVRRTGPGRLAATLLGAAAVVFAHAQTPQPPATESQARYWVYGAFLTHAVPEIMGERVALGPELEQRLGLPSGADRARVYDALMSYTDGKPLRVRKATPEEIARYKPQAKRELKDPVFTVQAGDIALLVEYDMQANAIPFVGQLSVVSPPPQPPVAAPPPVPVSPPVAASRAAPVPPPPPVAAPVPPPAPVAAPRAAPVPPPAPVATIAPKPAPARIPPPPPVVAKPQARVAPPPPPPAQPTGPCEVKPVMTDEDLANCRAAPSSAARVQPGPPPVIARPAAPPEPPRKPAATPCVVKPVMSEEDLVACGIRPR